MGKVLLRKASTAATEGVLAHLMPQLDARLVAMQQDIRALAADVRAVDAKVDSLRDEMMDRFERTLATINEVAHRVTRVEGKLEGYMEAMRLTLSQSGRPSRKRRAG